MERIAIIKELAQYCHPSWYHQILDWRIESLKKLLNYYKKESTYVIGIDMAIVDSDITNFNLQPPLFLKEMLGEEFKKLTELFDGGAVIGRG